MSERADIPGEPGELTAGEPVPDASLEVGGPSQIGMEPGAGALSWTRIAIGAGLAVVSTAAVTVVATLAATHRTAKFENASAYANGLVAGSRAGRYDGYRAGFRDGYEARDEDLGYHWDEDLDCLWDED